MTPVTPNFIKKVGSGVAAPSPMPFLTPRPERRVNESREFGRRSICQDRDGEVNVQVILRCRPLSDEEERANVPKLISCNEQKREVVAQQTVASKQLDRLFTFDKVFGPKAQQRSIYDQAIAPIVYEVLDGYNCTVFAYGQTGTGKTYTMEGEMRSKGGELPAEAGVIPRAVRQIFDTLEASNADYSMKVTFMELYNEEINDLLSPEESSRLIDDKQRKSISLMEDGRGSVIIRGLQEEVVYSANDIYNLLEQGAAKRRTADTLLNKRSSRSHSIFTITVHVRETNIGDDNLVKCGKLNLVDLAGSENISRSGSREVHAREAGEINKSLLTLGRVINALVEHSSHIPYRDSKLTRLLSDSLGGRTKTCIIATVSPSARCLDETLSTLDYACRAKRIKNKPEANQKMTKTLLLKDLYMEIERMKQDVRAAREKNGIYVPHERFALEEAEKKANLERIEQLEIDLRLCAKETKKYCELYVSEQEEKLDLKCKLKDCKVNLQSTNKALLDLQENYRRAMADIKEKELAISSLLSSENSLIERAKEMRSDLEIVADDITEMHQRIDQKDKLEAQNRELVLTFGSQLDMSLKDLHKTILVSVSQQQDQLRSIEEQTCSLLARRDESSRDLELKVKDMRETYALGIHTLTELTNALQKSAIMDLKEMNSAMLSQITAAEKFLDTAQTEAKEVLSSIQNSLCLQKQLLVVSAQKQQEGLEMTLVSAETITKETNRFFDNLCSRVSRLQSNLNESHTRNFHHLENFEKMFKEESAKEERRAADEIVAILGKLMSNKRSMVFEALKTIQHTRTQEHEQLGLELSNMQQVSIKGEKAMNEHLERAEQCFLEDSCFLTQTSITMEHHLDKCLEIVDLSRQIEERTRQSIGNLNSTSIADIRATMNKKIDEKKNEFDNYVSTSKSKDVEFDASIHSLMASITGSLAMDHRDIEGIDSTSTLCMDRLRFIQEKHSESISSIRNRAQSCLTKEYLVDQLRGPEMRGINIPSMESIEKMRTPCFDRHLKNLWYENKTNGVKIQRSQFCHKGSASPERAPFADATN
ncbi:hypothetical protein Droror1_Dr00008696 [Drosera rotundifolia]